MGIDSGARPEPGVTRLQIGSSTLVIHARVGVPKDLGPESSKVELHEANLMIAVPLWVERYLGLAVETLERRLHTIGELLRRPDMGEAAVIHIKGKTAEAFNLVAEGIAIMSFWPGGSYSHFHRWETVPCAQSAARMVGEFERREWMKANAARGPEVA